MYMNGSGKYSSYFLGITCTEGVVAPVVLGKLYNSKNIIRTPPNYSGWDYTARIGSTDTKIDCKSSCLREGFNPAHWDFNTSKNTSTNLFLFVAFDSREDLNVNHIWMVPAELVKDYRNVWIENTSESLNQWSKWEVSNGHNWEFEYNNTDGT